MYIMKPETLVSECWTATPSFPSAFHGENSWVATVACGFVFFSWLPLGIRSQELPLILATESVSFLLGPDHHGAVLLTNPNTWLHPMYLLSCFNISYSMNRFELSLPPLNSCGDWDSEKLGDFPKFVQ